jgi:phage gp36-like protein
MAYCASSDITAAITNDDLVQLTNDLGGETVDTTKITTAIDYVDNMIDGYLRGRYDLPLASTPDELKYVAVDLVVYRLYSRRMYTDVPTTVYQRYKDALMLLKDIQNGKFNLGVESTEAYDDAQFKINKTSASKKYDSDKWDTYSWL